APEAAPAAPFPRPVPEKESVPDRVRRAAHGEVEEVLGRPQGLARAPAQGEVFDLERRGLLSDQGRRRRVRALADGADLAVELAPAEAEEARDRRLGVALRPVVAQIPRRIGPDIGVQGVREAERAETDIEVERPGPL